MMELGENCWYLLGVLPSATGITQHFNTIETQYKSLLERYFISLMINHYWITPKSPSDLSLLYRSMKHHYIWSITIWSITSLLQISLLITIKITIKSPITIKHHYSPGNITIESSKPSNHYNQITIKHHQSPSNYYQSPSNYYQSPSVPSNTTKTSPSFQLANSHSQDHYIKITLDMGMCQNQ